MALLNRSFYEMAALVAHQGVDFKKPAVAKIDDFMQRSKMLDRDYQDCLFAFTAKGVPLKTELISGLAVTKTLNQFSKGRDGEELFNVDSHTFARDLALLRQRASQLFDWPERAITHKEGVFEPEALMALVVWVARHVLYSLNAPPPIVMTAPLFHEQLTKMAHKKTRRFFILTGLVGSRKLEIRVDRASLFSANRLRKKSWQNNVGTERGVRYYHAALRSNEEEELDLTYWLKFDEEHQVIAGDFINLDKSLNISLWSPYDDLCEEAVSYMRIQGIESAEDAIVREALSLYLQSLSS